MNDDRKIYKIDHKVNKSKIIDTTDHIQYHDLDLESNHIYLMGVDRGYEITDEGGEPGVDFWMANRFIKNMNLCMRVNPDKPIVIHMKTCGGIWEEGMAIYDMIKSCTNPVTILNYTHARSMSSIIFQAANKRIMMPNSHFMFHLGSLGVYGTVKGVESNVEFNHSLTGVMLDIYTESMKECDKFKGKSDMAIKKWLTDQMDKKEDVFLTAKETIEYGFADEIFNYDWSKLTEYTDKQLSR